jgi:hypothetical protein
MIVKTENVELEISARTDVVYFGSRTSGQIFKKWSDLTDNAKFRLESLHKKIETLIVEYEEILLEGQLSNNEVNKFKKLIRAKTFHD